ncbi:MAG: TonB family protein [Acidobacteria bacterium]|nr:TonB family protein [Acidobacteriota bacterium]
MSLTVSSCLHGSVLAWVMFSGPAMPRVSQSLYDEVIRPHEKEIIWYPLADKLPEIAPPESAADQRKLRARVRAKQEMVAGAADDPKPGPMIWLPDSPPVPAPRPKAERLPNLIAVAPPNVVRDFTPPRDAAPKLVEPKLPEPPRVEARVEAAPLPVDAKGAKPAPRAFVPPPEARMARQAAIELPDAPKTRETVVEANALPFAPAGARPRPRDFVPPPDAVPRVAPAAMPAPPPSTTRIPGTDALAALPRAFVPPPSRPVDRTAPAVTADAPAVSGHVTPGAQTTMAIVGLNPANTRELPPPPESRKSGFSGGPVERKEGASSTNGGVTLLNVPGLTVRGGAKDDAPVLAMPPFSPTSRENLVAAARTVGHAGRVVREDEPAAPRVSEAPDPRLAGRVVYTIAIQMPNVTSYSGSWMVWFAEREPLPGSARVDMRPPAPLRKVDPKYVAAAVAERVEGIIRLAAVIRKDGHVGDIALIHRLDNRLDRTAEEALAKWEFTPALRNGVPVDVDAVFEIPFRLAPRPGR